MKRKHYQLIEYLKFQKETYTSSSEIAKYLNVTNRTVRNYVKYINDNNSVDYSIESSKDGYRLSIKNTIFSDTNVTLYQDTETEYSILEFNILKFLLNRDDYVTYDEIAENFFYSSQIVRNRIQKLAFFIKELHIEVSIDTQIFKGIHLIGTEVQKRILLEIFYSNIDIPKEYFQEKTIHFFSDWINEERIKELFLLIDNMNEKYTINLDFYTYKKMIVQLIIIMHQIDVGRFVSLDITNLNYVREFPEYCLVEEIFKNQNIKNNDAEKLFLIDYFVSLQLGMTNIESIKKDNDIYNKIHLILKDVEKVNEIDVYTNKVFRENITNHIYRMISPASNNIISYNPFIREAKSEYIYSFSIATNIASKIEEVFNIEVYDDNIGYLSYHIQLILESKKKRKIQLIVLYSRNPQRAQLLSTKLLTYFKDVEIIDFKRFMSIDMLDEKMNYIGIDLTLEVRKENIVCISSNFDAFDIKKVNYFLTSLDDVISNASIHWLGNKTPESIIKELLVREEKLYLYEYILKRERMSSTSVGNLVAFPHPYLGDIKHDENIIIGILENQIMWGKELVELVIIFIPSSDIERNEFIFKEFYKKTKKIENVKELIKAKSKKDFNKIWNEI